MLELQLLCILLMIDETFVDCKQLMLLVSNWVQVMGKVQVCSDGYYIF